ncbi:homoserine kinase [Lactobacillus sp. S2-2]|uniref:homoserine kinase n=1 Tax=Lactobacillus sp. S2-2 TaxID=2692917 RepID=UPI001EFFCB75|nr:homoserine kinase [Lactobacillus sp. S2-2]MCF6515363.1 homoserine kinase [Lactobacillus sp. S2-2]
MITIKTPATSANLSVGYDCLGLAVNLYTTVTFSSNLEPLEITGVEEKYQNENNLIYRAFAKTCQKLSQIIPNLKINIQSDIPISRGLGSSAACIVSGIKGANAWFDNPLNNEEILEIATEMEGHPDNVAPAIYGGLCMSFIDQNQHSRVVNYPINDNLLFYTIIPDFKISTHEAISVLPTELSYADATNQISHSLYLIESFRTGNLNNLREAMHDKMHEPFRKKLIENYDEVSIICDTIENGLYISGSGSTMMGIADSQQKRTQAIKQLSSKFKNWKINPVEIDFNGAILQ